MRPRCLVLFLLLAACGGGTTGLQHDAAVTPDGTPGPDAAGRDAAPPDAAPPEGLRLAEDLTLSRIEAFQTVQIPLVDGDTAIASRNADVVAGRRMVLHAHVTPGPGFTAQTVRAVVRLREGATDRTFESEELIAGPSVPGDFATVIPVDLPAEAITPATQLGVALTTIGGTPTPTGQTHAARWPRDGQTAPLGAVEDGGGLHLVLVPVEWNSDGSGRLPDLGPARLASLEALLLALYPIASLNLEVREPLPWSDGLTWTGNVDFGDLNDALIDLREDDGAPADAYYYAVVKPDTSFSAYCGGSCVTGQSYVVSDPEDAWIRVGSGVGFDGDDWTWTLAHETGHMHGRGHAPCDVSSSDPDYPYDYGLIGVWGLDPRATLYLDPEVYGDLMGYCDDTWISDYTYQALLDRVQAVNALPAFKSAAGPERFRVLRVEAEGTRTWGRTVRRTPSWGEALVPLDLPAEAGLPARTVSVAAARLAHGGAVSYFVPIALAPPSPSSH